MNVETFYDAVKIRHRLTTGDHGPVGDKRLIRKSLYPATLTNIAAHLARLVIAIFLTMTINFSQLEDYSSF